MNNDLISREALKKMVYTKFGNSNLSDAFNDIIDNAPTVEIATKLQPNCNQIAIICNKLKKEDCGKWIFHEDFNESIKYGCNQCGNLTNISSNFCPNCGAKMEKWKRGAEE